jgi:hypothetical protein
MFYALRGAFSLALLILVLQIFLPEIANGLVEVVIKMIHLANTSLDHTLANMPY